MSVARILCLTISAVFTCTLASLCFDFVFIFFAGVFSGTRYLGGTSRLFIIVSIYSEYSYLECSEGPLEV